MCLRNHCCNGKAISITFFCVCVGARACDCARVALLMQHAKRRHVSCGLWLHQIFRHFLINDTIFGKTLLNIKCVFSFYLQRLSETFLIIRIIQRDTVINVKTSSCGVPVILVRF